MRGGHSCEVYFCIKVTDWCSCNLALIQGLALVHGVGGTIEGFYCTTIVVKKNNVPCNIMMYLSSIHQIAAHSMVTALKMIVWGGGGVSKTN